MSPKCGIVAVGCFAAVIGCFVSHHQAGMSGVAQGCRSQLLLSRVNRRHCRHAFIDTLFIHIHERIHRTAADEVGGRNAVLVARVLDAARAEIEIKDGDRIRVLVGNQKVLSGMIELEVPWCVASRVEMPDQIQPTLLPALHLVHADGLVSAIAHHDEMAGLVNADASAGVHRFGKCGRQSADGLDEAQGAASLESCHILAVARRRVHFLEQIAIDLEHCHCGAELIDDVGNVVLRMELQVPRAVGVSRAQPRWQHVGFMHDLSLCAIVEEFADDVLSQIRNVRNGPNERIQHQRMRVRISLPLLDGGSIVAGMVGSAILFR
mmetsp:Transcript_21709/g.60421  ORF Transcript_21709/g.60421 Transcript_21709/m.60421 type:complete len:322 (-) Transcript_21709:275-1240(-)